MAGPAIAQTAPESSGTDAEIARLAGQLSNPSYAKRVGATRRLCAIGAPALDTLRQLAAGDDMEAALRARKIIQALEHVYFGGVEIHLEAAQTSIAWDEPIDLRIVLENRSPYPARVPFAIDSNTTADGDDARQVAAMVDASDWLMVTTPQGRPLDLHVDEISDDPAVLQVIHERLASGPVSVLQPGQRAVVLLTAFNRGWARYPLLDEGSYRVQLSYVPQWSDPVLAEQRAGETRSNELTVQVTSAAPPAVSRRGGHAELTLRREQDDLVIGLINHADQVMLINTNYGVSVPFAELNWIYDKEGRRVSIPVSASLGRNWGDFDAKRFIAVESGATLQLTRVPLTDVRNALSQAGVRVSAPDATLSASYFNLGNRQWQMREQAHLSKDPSLPPILRAPLPRQLLATRLTSPSLRFESAP